MKNFSVGIYFDTRRAKSNAQYPVYLKLYREQKNVYVDTGMSSCKNGFSGDRFVGTSSKAVRLNNELRTLYDRFRLWCLDFDDKGMPNSTVKKFAEAYLSHYIIKREYTDNTTMTLLECFDEYVEHNVHTEGTRKVYETNKNRLKEYDKLVYLRDIESSWLRSFDNWMEKQGMKINTRSQAMRCIRTIFNYALEQEYVNHYPFRSFKIKQEETPMRTLTREEIITLRDYPCKTPWQEKARDMWMLSFYLFGINNGDLFTLKKLTHGRCQYRRGKTHRLYDVAVPPEAMEIIKRYKGKNYLLDICDTNKDYHSYVKHLNESLKTIGMDMRNGCKHTGEALFPDLSMYWARYSGATLMAELDIPMETISQCLGHSSGLRVTQIYVKFNQKKIDEAQKKMIAALKVTHKSKKVSKLS